MENEVWNTIKSLNDCWTKRNSLEKVRGYFHNNAVALVGKDRERIVGGDACAEHWKECSKQTIHSWEELSPKVTIFDEKFAVVSYEFTISLERDGRIVDATNRDSFSLVNENGNWVIVLATV